MQLRAVLSAWVTAVVLAAAPRPALALQSGGEPAASAARSASPAAPAPEEVALDSPRASIKRFLELCRAGEYAEAAGYLDLSDAQKVEGPQLARRLKAVLDHWMWGKVETISASPVGEVGDHLPAGVDEVGTIPGPSGPEPVRLIRRHLPEGTRWIFSRTTVEHVDAWFGRLGDRWQQQYLPERLLRPGPKELLWWQWIALPVLFVLSLGVGQVLALVTRLVIARAFSRTAIHWDRALLARLGGPLAMVWSVAGVELSVPLLALYPPAQAFIDGVVRAGFFVGALWFLNRCVEIGGVRILEMPDAKNNPAARSLVPLGTKSLKVVLVVFAVLIGLSAMGVAVGSLLAGLGLGGVALALAAQKTVENLFGSLSIGVDQPFRVGDYITVDTISGTVESIGLRSTRIRTLDRTLVTIPNGKLADMRIESFAGRDRIKLGLCLSLDRSATADQVRAVVAGARELITAHPKVWPEVMVAMTRIADASFDVEVLAWFTTSWDEFVAIREEVLLGLLAVVDKAGAKLAIPPDPGKRAK
jgi:MscS family membrane protein